MFSIQQRAKIIIWLGYKYINYDSRIPAFDSTGTVCILSLDRSIECMQKNCRQACFPYVYICNLAVVQDIVFVGMPASNGFNKI